MSEKPKDTYFSKVDVAEALKFLKDSVTGKAQVYVWTKGHRNSFYSKITAISIPTQTLYLDSPVDLDLKAFVAHLKSNGNMDCYFNIVLTRGSVFFATFFKGHDVGGLRFQFPEALYKVQRREAVRVPIPLSVPVLLEFTDPLYTETRLERRAADLSAHGMSFVGREADRAAFIPGTTLKGAVLRLKNREIYLEAQIRNVRTFIDGKKKGIKVGLRFEKIRPADVQLISSVVFELSRRGTSR
ncbi:MAG: PilZ domain-containing protein [Bdellovibrionota bacterium]